MSNPNIYQGTLNRLLASVIYSSVPQLNLISGFLAREQISITFQTPASKGIPTSTNRVISPEPYQIVLVTMHVVKSNIIGQLYKNQFETNTSIGTVNIIPDTVTLSPYQLDSCTLINIQDMPFDGNSASMIVTLEGTYFTNSSMFIGS